MKASLQPGKSFGSAASSAPAQRKGRLKTITDNRPTAIAQRKLQGVVQAKALSNKTTVLQAVFDMNSGQPTNASFRYENSALRHLTEQELRNDFDNMEAQVMHLWHQTMNFETGGNIHIYTENVHYIMRFAPHRYFTIFHTDRRDNYKAENNNIRKDRYNRDNGGGGGDLLKGKDLGKLSSSDYQDIFGF